MFSQSAYSAWLDNRAGQIFEKVSKQETITNEETLVLILKAQNDQLRQLAEAIEARFEQVEARFEQVDKRFEQIDRRFEQVDKRFEQLSNNFKWGLISAMGFISLLMTILRFVP